MAKIYRAIRNRCYTADGITQGRTFSLYASGEEKIFSKKEDAENFIGGDLGVRLFSGGKMVNIVEELDLNEGSN